MCTLIYTYAQPQAVAFVLAVCRGTQNAHTWFTGRADSLAYLKRYVMRPRFKS